jgi:DNA polymerase III epsilon subunit-like protein
MIVIFDTETNGLPKDYKASMRQVDNWPRVIQLAWAAFSFEGVLIDSRCSLIQPDGWVIPAEPFWINNGYATETNREQGLPIKDELLRLGNYLMQARYLVAHNIAFDSNIVGAEWIRAGLNPIKGFEKVCTMITSTDFCQLPNVQQRYPGYKWPKLEELHQKLFGEGFENAHDALADVQACGRCFFEMAQREIIKINELQPQPQGL